jgi:hypothetical protein
LRGSANRLGKRSDQSRWTLPPFKNPSKSTCQAPNSTKFNHQNRKVQQTRHFPQQKYFHPMWHFSYAPFAKIELDRKRGPAEKAGPSRFNRKGTDLHSKSGRRSFLLKTLHTFDGIGDPRHLIFARPPSRETLSTPRTQSLHDHGMSRISTDRISQGRAGVSAETIARSSRGLRPGQH